MQKICWCDGPTCSILSMFSKQYLLHYSKRVIFDIGTMHNGSTFQLLWIQWREWIIRNDHSKITDFFLSCSGENQEFWVNCELPLTGSTLLHYVASTVSKLIFISQLIKISILIRHFAILHILIILKLLTKIN